MFKTGITTVTFLDRSAEENIEIVKRAELNGIEWADKYHVISGDFEEAKRIERLTRKAGLEVLSYGSFYNPSKIGFNGLGYFEKTLACALYLQTGVIRIWAGNCGSNEMTDSCRKMVIDELRTACKMAAKYDITVATEYHPHTLTDTPESTVRLLNEVHCNNFKPYWQTATYDLTFEENCTGLKMIIPFLSNVHVFSWDHIRRPLVYHEQNWKEYIKLLRQAEADCSLLIEFVADGTPESLYADAAVLKEWLKSES
jgi:3-dehydroshikimate dehydratase